MDKVFENETQQIFYDKNDNLLYVKFITTDYLEEEVLFDYLKEMVPLLQQYKPEKVIIDTQSASFPITDQVSQWILNNITPEFKANGVKKVAYVLPKDLLSRTGIELFVETLYSSVQEISRMAFDNFDQALAWIKK